MSDDQDEDYIYGLDFMLAHPDAYSDLETFKATEQVLVDRLESNPSSVLQYGPLLASALRAFFAGVPAEQWRKNMVRELEDGAYREFVHHLRHRRGLRAWEAEEEAAQLFRVSADAMLQRRKRARRRRK